MRAIIRVSSLLIAATCFSCSNNDSNGGTTPGSGGPPAASATADEAGAPADGGPPPTFTQVYSTVIANRCTPCHTQAGGDGIKFGNLDMTTRDAAYADLVNAKTAGVSCGGKGVRVTAGKPDDSIMYLKVSLDDPTPCGSKMPLGGPPLSQSDADLIEAWITAGAKND
jgi:hypothetical protein